MCAEGGDRWLKHGRNNVGGEVSKLRAQTEKTQGRVEGAIASFDAAIRINPEDAEVYFNRGLARKALQQFALAKDDLEYALTLAQEQGLTEFSLFVNRELDKLNEEQFSVEPYSSKYVAGVAPEKLKDKLNELDEELFIRKVPK